MLKKIAALIALVALLVLVYPLISERSGYDEAQAVRTELDEIARGLLAYERKNGRFPTRREITVLFSRDEDELRDRWGSPIVFSLSSGTPRLYSFGKNEQNDGGFGDDIQPSQTFVDEFESTL